ncbi:F-box protein DOR [Raphanus sativus]|uniref:F-box protein DOR-like n=1 Tax=Raphanus sativus TaxID=3726 RepID=A0A9W3DHW3_RAPSA|nr:F-box protein DOR-like [Raphanus sativus]KAJ4903366.1 F-box protein DOR [Raphanus sativus]
MKSPRYIVSENPQTTLRCHSRDSSPIPIDLIIEILLRLPLKSIAICRCVCKFLASALVRPDFTDSFLASSSARPQILFACQNHDKNEVMLYFSASQSQNSDDSSSTIVSNHHMGFPVDSLNLKCSAVSGFVCVEDHQIIKGRKNPKLVWVICNPSTGQSFTLPKMNTRKRSCITCFLGYDPIDKQHKVLAMTFEPTKAEDHQVLTLGGTEKLTWRRIECGIPQYGSPGTHSICINGVLYFKAKGNRSSNGQDMIVCFDVRSEKYNFVKVMERAEHPEATLVNYNGKLALVSSQYPFTGLICSSSRGFEMWVLQDSEKHEWSNHIYKLPSLSEYICGGQNLFFVGVTGGNEIALCRNYVFRRPFYVYYYNLNCGTIRRVEVQGMGPFDGVYRVDTFLNHVEDMKFY